MGIKNNTLVKDENIIHLGRKKVIDYVKSILNEDTLILQDDISVLDTEKLDIYIPDHNIAIDYNSVYQHKEDDLDNKYSHYNKWKQCQDKGIQLITIWDIHWENKDKRHIIENLLCHKLGVSDKENFC